MPTWPPSMVRVPPWSTQYTDAGLGIPHAHPTPPRMPTSKTETRRIRLPLPHESRGRTDGVYHATTPHSKGEGEPKLRSQDLKLARWAVAETRSTEEPPATGQSFRGSPSSGELCPPTRRVRPTGAERRARIERRGWGSCPTTEAVWPAPRPETSVSTRENRHDPRREVRGLRG